MKIQFTALTNAETQRTQSQTEKGIHDFLRVSPRPRRLCVKLPLASLLLCVFALIPLGLRAATNDLTTALQKGLFEEEANHNLDAAISNYQALATQFDRDRQIAATAIFRLGECYRKLGRDNDAVVQYQRIVREFPDQQTLATLSQQNLTGLGVASQPRFQERLVAIIKKNPQDSIAPAIPESAARVAVMEAEAASLKAQIEHLSSLKQEGRRVAIQQNYSNPVLTKLMQDLAEAELTLASLTNDYAPADLHVTRVTALMNALNGQIDAQMNGVIDGLQTKMEADLNAAKILRAQSGPASAVPTEASPATDDEDREIRRIQQLIQDSPDLINAPASDGFTPLGNAARNGQVKVATFLLDHSAGINVAQRYGMTALHGATRAGNRAMVELLLSRGANVNAKDGSDETALHLALERNFPAVVETLLAAKADVNAADRNGVTPLMLAAKNGNRKLAAAMLELGADPNLQNKISPGSPSPPVEQAGTALHVAAARNDAAMVALLLTNHADVKLRSVTGWTPLDVAASAGATEVAAQLIAAGADVNAAGPVDSTGGATPLLRAAGNDHSDTVKLLLEHGANPNTAYITGAGSTPLMLAAGQGNTEIAGLLLEHGARTDLKDNEHNTSLYRAVNRGNVKVVQLLLAHGANPNERNPNGIPLLIVVTADKSNPDLLAAFLKAKADVNAANSSGQTALFYAIRGGRKDLAEMLLAAGADPNLCNLDGQTPLDLARQQSGSSGPDSTSIPAGISSASLADLLRQHGALDNLPRWDRIEVSRPSANFSATALLKGTNDWNQFSLFELLARHYRLLSDDQPRDPPGRIWGSIQKVLRDTLPFPDLRRVQIHRPEADGRKWTSLPIDLEDLLSSGDCARDVALHWGDIVEIPEADHPVADQWKGLGASAWTNLIRCISRTVTIAINGQASNLRLAPVFVENTNEYASIFVEADVLEHGGISIRPEACMLRPVLDQSKRVRFSSDLSRVKVTRLDPKTRKKREWTLDCTGTSPAALWLRDGDVIEVPEK